MIIKPHDKSLVGQDLRLPDWTHCRFRVIDIGFEFITGIVYDGDRPIVQEARSIHLDWEPWNGSS